MISNRSRGFTIIELLVVIAIIAVLASIVLVNVTQYINKSKDAAIKGNLATILTNSAVHFDTNGNYTNFCASSLVTGPSSAITTAGGTPMSVCTATNFCACSPEKATTTTVFCVDATGAKKEVASTTCAATCPAAAVCQ